MKIAVTGATGFIGEELILEAFLSDIQIKCLVRNPKQTFDLPVEVVKWDSNEKGKDLSAKISGLDAIIHLAGYSVADGRWTDKNKALIRSSRIDSTKNFVEAMALLPPSERPKSFICASAIGIYGDRRNETLTEASPAGSGFLVEVVKDWESEAHKAEELGVRVVSGRFGVVLGAGGGAITKMKPVVLGSGKQWISWVHREDVVNFLIWSLKNSAVSGVFNVVAPHPVTNQSFTEALAQSTNSPLIPIKTPAIVLKAALGEMSSILLDSAKVLPERTLKEGYKFKYPTLSSAFEEIFPTRHKGSARISAAQFVARPLNEVFDFFSKAENLEVLTPPWLGFHIKSMSTPQIQKDTLINYDLKIHGLPVRWQTLIEDWTPPRQFVDVQLKGPYSKWHHTHTFQSVKGGTLIRDDVFYRLPFGAVGQTFGGAWVKRDVNGIFGFRKQKIKQLFGAE